MFSNRKYWNTRNCHRCLERKYSIADVVVHRDNGYEMPAILNNNKRTETTSKSLTPAAKKKRFRDDGENADYVETSYWLSNA